MKKLKVLVSDGDQKHTLGIVRALGKIGYEVHTYSNKSKSLTSYSKYCTKAHIIELSSRDGYVKLLQKLHAIENYDCIIPVGSGTVSDISYCYEKLPIEIQTKIVIAKKSNIEIALSKIKTYRHAEKLGLNVPKTYIPNSFDEILSISENLSFPIVIKAQNEMGANVVDYANNSNELIEKFKNMCQEHSFDENELPMIQEYISGHGEGFFAIYKDGVCGQTFQHKRIREYPVTGGMSVCAESSVNNAVEMYGKRLLDSLEWHGIAMVEFKVNKNNIPYLMEINPKFWGSLDLAIEAGANFPKEMVDIARGVSDLKNKEYAYPFRYHWPLHGDILISIGSFNLFFNFIKDCLDPRVKSNLHIISDFSGTVGICFNLMRKLLIKLKSRL